MDIDNLLRHLAISQCCRFGTTAPFTLGEIQIQKVGFAQIPVIGMQVICPAAASRSMTPIVRSLVFMELETAGLTNEAVEFVPRVSTGKYRKFVDINESSPTLGKNKMGYEYTFSFEIRPEYVKCFTWGGWCGNNGKIGHRTDALELLASDLIGDGESPNVFFVTLDGNVQLITTDGPVAYRFWKNLPRNVESSLEDRQTGCICTVEPLEDEDNSPLVVRDDAPRSMCSY